MWVSVDRMKHRRTPVSSMTHMSLAFGEASRKRESSGSTLPWPPALQDGVWSRARAVGSGRSAPSRLDQYCEAFLGTAALIHFLTTRFLVEQCSSRNVSK